MRTVGQILKEEREKKFYSLEEIEKATKIRKELLEALENDDFEKLPPPTFIQGFIKNYARFLKLDSEKLLAIFRREFSDVKNPPRVLESFSNPVDKKKFSLTPTKVISGVVIFLILVFFTYLWFEYRFLTSAPFLEVDSPQDKITVSSPTVRVVGKTDPEDQVTINDQQINVSPNGGFSQEIQLEGSSNTITVTATSKSGKSTLIKRTVFLQQ
ncbi:MAG: helix-turn-helix domain-containing protein [Candidatus Daviesbacteria bacterium]|nr:MAG: helix-turn-helix domain-containing protein [Candidatus Daviesbacteria bacterium]